jgi:hypothetical protein
MSSSNSLSAGIELVSHDVRAAILLALAAQMREHPRDEGLRFSALRERVGHDDPGNFNYHLKRLLGTLVEKTDEEYMLSDIGHHFVSVLQSGRFDPDRRRDFPEVETGCLLCAGRATVSYEDGSLRTACENGHGSVLNVGPDLLETHSVTEALNVATRRTLWEAKSTIDGVCPYCEGETTGTVSRPSTGPEPVIYEWTCESCGVFLQNSAGGCVVFHPSVISFCYRQGVDVFQHTWDVLADHTSTGVVRSENPLRVEVTFSIDDECLTLTVDESAAVVETSDEAGPS